MSYGTETPVSGLPPLLSISTVVENDGTWSDANPKSGKKWLNSYPLILTVTESGTQSGLQPPPHENGMVW